jgi:hypothetical protein
MKALFVTLATTLLLSCGCANISKTTKVDKIGSKEAVVFARVKILKDGAEFSENSNLVVNQVGHKGWGSARQHPGIKDDLFCARLPVGDYYFFHITAGKGLFTVYRYAFPPGQTTFAVPEPGRTYYLGDITIDWKPDSRSHETEAAILGGVVGAALTPTPGGTTLVTVRDNLADAQRVFRDKFHTNRDLLPSLIKIDLSKNGQPAPKPEK